MEQEFFEYILPYKDAQLRSYLENYLQLYLKETKPEKANEIRVILENMINTISNIKNNNTSVLYINNFDATMNPEVALTILLNNLPSYFFKKEEQKTMLKEHYIYREFVPFHKSSFYVMDFMNYIAKKNDFSRNFSLKELYDRFNKQQYYKEMRELKKFIQVVYSYYEDIKNGDTADGLLENAFMDMGHILPYDIDVDASAYAYYRVTEDNLAITPSKGDEEIIKRIQRMKKR